MTRERPFIVKRSVTGLGVFATKRIHKGTKIVEYTGPRVPNDVVEQSNGKYFFGVNKKWSIDGSGRDNIARYINHSCAPNAEAIIDRNRVWIWSLKTIERGEEIVYDYGKEYFDGVIKDIGCKCLKCSPAIHRNDHARRRRRSGGVRI
ncbi:MAG TPA: SET domain-containing protein [Pyrinomonadaceae bacterium]|jgi:SET domain-containing protein|nr:SET domain-containing protein [Pyrinomonadaceae bacterium]